VSTRTFATVIILAVITAIAGMAGSDVIGVAVSNGKMQVDRSEVTGNANLSEGSSVRTQVEPSRIQWKNGGKAALAPNSTARVFGDRIVLEQGTGFVSTPALRAQAKGFDVFPVDGGQAQVSVRDGVVQVAALSGTVKVKGSDGLMLAKVVPGKALDLAPGSGAPGVSTMTGVLRSEGGKFLLKDQITNLDVELRGGNLVPEAGKLVEVTGKASASADRESQVIEVAKLTRMEPDPQSGGARPTEAGSKPTSGPKQESKSGGLSNGAKVGIGVAAAGGGAAVVVFATMSK